MSSSNSKYFAVTPIDQSELFKWASKNEMKLIGQPVTLPSCQRAWELDTRDNAEIHLDMALLGQGRMRLMNDQKAIGIAHFDHLMANRTGINHVVVSPFCF